MSICERCKQEHNGLFGSGRFCSISCANTQIHSQKTKDKISNSVKNSEIFKIKNRESHLIVPKIELICPLCNKTFYCYSTQKTIFCSRKCFDIDVQNGHIYSKNPKSGGYRKGSGIGKKGWYNEIWCDSSYELAYVIFNIDHNIKFQRNHQFFEYSYQNHKFKYYPDFIENNIFIEIKGFITDKDYEKIKQFPSDKKLILLHGININKPYLEYVKSVYGNNFINKYNGTP